MKKASLLIVFVTVFIDLLGFGIVLPLLPRYGRYFEADRWLGLLMASFSAMQFLFAPIWGRVSDRVGRRPILILGLAGSTVCYFLFGYATGLGQDGQMLGLGALGWLFISRIGAGIFGATIPTAQAYIADVTGPQDRAKGMALVGAAFGIGFTFGPLIGSFFVTDSLTGPPSAAPGYVASALSGIAMLAAIVLLAESRVAGAGAAKHDWLNFRSFRKAVGRPVIGLILLTMFLTTFAFAQFESTLALLTETLGLSERNNFYVFAYIGFILALSQGVLVRRLVPVLGEIRMSLAGAVLMTAGLLLVAFSGVQQSRWLLYAVLPVSVVGFSALTPSLQSLLSRRSPQAAQGEILGAGQSVAALARILGPYIGIRLFQVESTYPYWEAGAVMAVGIVLVLLLRSSPSDEDFQPVAASTEA